MTMRDDEVDRIRRKFPEMFAEIGGGPGDISISGGLGKIDDVCAEDVSVTAVEWLWHRRVPKGKVTMFDGDPDVGKSAVTVDIAARKSAGRAFPDGAPCEAGNVLIANVEDDAGDTIVPRLKAAGADLTRVFIIAGVPDGKGGTRLLDLPEDIPLLEAKAKERNAALLIIDPVMTMLGGDANKDQDARKALTPLKSMAERTGVAVVCVRHLNKSVGLKAIQRGGGNMGLIGVARAGAYFAEHPNEAGLRIMAPHKSNLAEKPPSLAYRIVTSAVHDTARIEWKGVVDLDANSLASSGASGDARSVLDDAAEFLREELSADPIWVKQIFKDARDAGIAEITLRRAKDALGVKAEKQGVEGWAWRLPTPPPRPEGDHEHPHDNVEHLDHVDHLQNGRDTESLYIKEGDQGDQGDQGDHGNEDDHVHDHLQNGSPFPGEDFDSTLHRQGPSKGTEDKGGGEVGSQPDNLAFGDGGFAPGSGKGGDDVAKNGSRRLTPGEARDVQRRMSQGMSADMARAEVLATRTKDHPPDCPCEVCA